MGKVPLLLQGTFLAPCCQIGGFYAADWQNRAVRSIPNEADDAILTEFDSFAGRATSLLVAGNTENQ